MFMFYTLKNVIITFVFLLIIVVYLNVFNKKESHSKIALYISILYTIYFLMRHFNNLNILFDKSISLSSFLVILVNIVVTSIPTIILIAYIYFLKRKKKIEKENLKIIIKNL